MHIKVLIENFLNSFYFSPLQNYYNSVTIKYSFIYKVLITLHGLPTATLFSGISFVTTLPAPITQLSPIFTPGNTTTFPPIHTLFPTSIGLAYSNPNLTASILEQY